MAQAVVVGADGVSITRPRNGCLGTVAASDDVVLEMDHDKYDTGEGLCLDAVTEGERFHILSLREEDRWPAFVRLRSPPSALVRERGLPTCCLHTGQDHDHPSLVIMALTCDDAL